MNDSMRRWGRLPHRRGHPAAAAAPRIIDRLAGPFDDPLLDLLLEKTPIGVLVVDRRGRLVRANTAVRQMCGRAVDPLRLQAATHLFQPDERDLLWARLQPLLLGAPPAAPIHATLQHEGEEGGLAVEITVLPLRESDGSISGLLLRLTDISVQKRLEAQLAQSQKLQAVGQLAAGIAHDFNNLLTAVIGAADMIADRPGVDAETLDDAATVRTSADRGANLVRQLLAFGRQQALLPKAIPINDAIENLSGMLTRLLGGTIDLVRELESPGCSARVDPTQLDQVLVNLAINGADAMPGGGRLTLRSGHITLHRPLVRGPETIPPGRYVMIEVQDTGEGIDPALLPRIFDPFFTTRRARGGTGLGLSTVHGIVRQSGGFLGVESEQGLGTRLRVYLPRHDEAGAVTIPLMPSAAPRDRRPEVPELRPACGPRPIVLLVDDEAPVRLLAERALAQAGWLVWSADSGKAALDLIAERGVAGLSLLISDVMMQGIDGPSLVSRLRVIAGAIPAILVSGYADEVLRRQLTQTDVTFLSKPYRLAELVEAARRQVPKEM